MKLEFIDIVDQLDDLACRLGYKQETIAKKLEVSQSTYSRWIRGERFPRKKNLLKIKDLYEVLLRKYSIKEYKFN
jgi:transcriptional regulator with XRE-family HTH domain